MLEKSTVEFLEQIAVEKEPLSEEEKREAIEIAFQVREISIKKSKGKQVSSFVNRYSDHQQAINVFLDKEDIEAFKPTNPKTDLVINVSKLAKDSDGNVVLKDSQKIYFFAPDEVAVVEFGVNGIKVGFTGYDQVRRGVEQMTREEYHPGKADLIGLKSDLSSAEPMTY